MIGRGALSAAVVLALSACTPIVRYTDQLVSTDSGRTPFTRAPASFGGIVGFVVGVPIDVAVVPITWGVYAYQDDATRDPLSIFLFPSFVLWRVGTLIAAPIDVVEWACWRSWQSDESLTPEERERVEREYDDAQQQWTDYPVEWIYPRAPQVGG